MITWNMQGANEGSANTNKWFNNVRTYARQAQIVMLQEAGPWPSESAHQLDDITRTTVNSNGNTTTQTIRQFLWSVRDGDYRNVYFVHTQNGQGGRVNLAIVTDGEPDEVNVVQNPVNAGRVALGVRFGNNWYFTVHGLSGGGGDSAVLLDAIDTAVANWQPPGADYTWTAGGDFNIDPDTLSQRNGFPPAIPVSTPSGVPTHNSGNRLDYFVTNDLPVDRQSAFIAGDFQPPSDHRVVGLGRLRAAGEPPSDIRLLPLGDDLVQGVGSSNDSGARDEIQDELGKVTLDSLYGHLPGDTPSTGALWSSLSERDMVGGHSNGEGIPDGDNEGWQGYSLRQLEDRWGQVRLGPVSSPTVAGAQRAAAEESAIPTPNVVMLLAGLTDLIHDDDVAGAAGRLGGLIDAVQSRVPNAAIVVGTLPPSGDADLQTRIDQYNAAVRTMVNDRDVKGEHLVLVELTAVTTGDLVDGVHPGDGGYQKIAEAFEAGIYSALVDGWIKNPPSTGTALRVLPFGDSITWGFQSSDGGGYRCHLQDNLDALGYGYQFVGSQSAGNCAQPNNEGHSGWTIGQLAGIEKCTIREYKPNVVLLDVGTNDINNGGAPGPAVTALKDLVNSILSDDPGVTVLVSSLIPTPNATVAANMASFNQQISSWISSVSPEKHVLYVDQGAVQTGDLADGLHPNDTGYKKMASAWATAISTASGNGWINAADTAGSGGCTGGGPVWHPQGVIATGPGTAPADQPGGGPLQTDAHVQFADITGDGRADYLQINANGSVVAWLNTGPNGAGGVVWKSVGTIASGVGSPGSKVQFADLTGDGKADYLVIDHDGTEAAWANGGQNASAQNGWLWNKLGTLADPAGRALYVDIDGDGKADYLDVYPNGSVYAYLNAGAPSSWIPKGKIASGVGSPGSEVQFADLTGDGKADYLVVDSASGAVTLWQNGGANAGANNGWVWNPHGKIASGVAPGAQIQFGDINKDGKADYLDVDPFNGSVTAYQNGGASSSAPNGWVWKPLGAIASGIGNQIQFADVTGDGRDDYLDVRPDGSVLAWNNADRDSNGKIIWVGPNTIATGTGAPGAQVHFADVFGTGRADYLVVDPTTGAVTAWKNEGPASSGTSSINWAAKGVIATGVGVPGSEVRFADLWGTGRADYLTVDPATGAVEDWYNAGLGSNGLPVWVPHQEIATGVAPGNQIRFADLDGTGGRDDYLVVNPDSSAQAWVNGGANPAAQNGWLWQPLGTVATGVGAPGSQIQFADLTGSGRDDYLNVNPDGSVSAWINGGAQ